jgi:hypothetical protein
MKITLEIAAAFWVFVISSFGQTQVTPVQKVGYPNLDLVYRAAKTINAATSVGVTYAKFGDLVQNLATEISIAEDKVTTARERTVLEKYKAVLLAYKLSNDEWTLFIKNSKATDNSITQEIWSGAAKLLRTANAYYLNDTKVIAAVEAEAKAEAAAAAKAEAEAKAEAKAREAQYAQELPIYLKEVDEYVQGLAPELRESVKKECLELGPHAGVWYRQGDPYYHFGIMNCRGIPDKEKVAYVRDAKQIELREAIKIAKRCPVCDSPIKSIKR